MTPLDLPYITFEENTFNEGEDYTFKLSASYNNGTANATLDFEANKAPNWGTFYINKNSGVEFVDVFTMKALDWKDPEEIDYPLKYGFRYIDDDAVHVDLRRPAEDSTLQTTLSRLTAGDMTLILCVYDSLDAMTQVIRTVTIIGQDDEGRATAISSLIEGLASS